MLLRVEDVMVDTNTEHSNGNQLKILNCDLK